MFYLIKEQKVTFERLYETEGANLLPDTFFYCFQRENAFYLTAKHPGLQKQFTDQSLFTGL